MSHKSQFGYLMDLLEITGKEMSIKTSVDRTLISKWKNNARQIKVNSKHFHQLIEAFIAFNKTRTDKVLERFFREIYPSIDRNEPDYLKTCLETWLIGQDLGYFHSFSDWRKSQNALYTTNIEVFKGNQGKRDAIMEFFRTAADMPPGQEIFISDNELVDWLIEDDLFNADYHQKLHNLAVYGHNITIIFNGKSAEHMLDNFQYFRLSKYFTGNVTAYQASRDMGPSLYIIHKHMLLLSMSADMDSDNRYISIYRDPFSIQQMVQMFMLRLQRASQMISTYSSHGTSLKGFTENLLTAIQGRDNSYFISPLPPFSTMPENILKEILESHDMTDVQTYELMQIHKVNKTMFFSNLEKSCLDEIISKNRLEEALSEDKIRLDDISAIIRKDVYITRDQLIAHLRALSDLTSQYQDFNITVATFDEIPLLESCMLWLIEDQMLYSYPLTGETHFVISDTKFILSKVTHLIQDLLMEHEESKSLDMYIEDF